MKYKIKNKKINVAFFIDRILWPTAGTENQLIRLISSLDKDIFKPHLVVLEQSKFVEENGDLCEIYALKIKKILSLRGVLEVFRAAAWLREKKIDIVQTFFRDATLVGIMGAKLGGVSRILSSRRNMRYDSNTSKPFSEKILSKFVDFYVANGFEVKKHVVRTEHVEPEKIKVFHNLLKTSNVKSLPPVDRKKVVPFVAENDVVFLLIANLRPVKSHDFLLKTINEISSRIPNAKFVFVGGEPTGQQIIETPPYLLAQKLDLMKYVYFAGLQEDVAPYLSIADVGILCSSSEGFSSSLLESISCGLPCIATDVGSNSEIVIDGHNGFLVSHGDQNYLGEKIHKLYSEKPLRERMGANSLQHFNKNFRPEAIILQMEKFYQEISSS